MSILEYFQIGNNASFPISEADVIRITQKIAMALHDVQNAKNPGGTLLFISCHIKNTHGLAIFKVEREDGVRIEKDITDQGKTTFSAQHVNDLLLGSRTKLFKIALFYQRKEEVIGFVCDRQQAVGSKDIADFFLIDFLGCQFKEEPRVSTKNFFNVTRTFINSDNFTDDEKLSMSHHLVSELTANQPHINTLSFAKRAMPIGETQKYMDTLKAYNVPSNFNKDLELVQDHLSNIKYVLTSGIKIYGTRNALEKNLKMIPCDDGKTRFELIDSIEKVS